MNIAIISGSMRTGSQSLKVSKWLTEHASKLEIDASVVDLHELKLPIFDVGETEAPNAPKVLTALEEADAVVFVSPEWGGTMSTGIVNMLQYVGTELAHKPVMLVGVTAGRNGHYPIMQMRIMGYKNNHFVISPESLLVQGVNDVLNDHEMPEEGGDASVKKRADYALRILKEYAQALKSVRDSGVVDHENFPNGV